MNSAGPPPGWWAPGRAEDPSSRWVRGSTAGVRTWPSSREATDGDSTDSPRARPHGPEQLLLGGVLEQVAGGPGLDRREDVAVGLVGGEDQHLGGHAPLGHAGDRGRPVDLGHAGPSGPRRAEGLGQVTASAPSPATPTTSNRGSPVNIPCRPSRTTGWSSTIRRRIGSSASGGLDGRRRRTRRCRRPARTRSPGSRPAGPPAGASPSGRTRRRCRGAPRRGRSRPRRRGRPG